jgi:glutathione S-transferase
VQSGERPTQGGGADTGPIEWGPSQTFLKTSIAFILAVVVIYDISLFLFTGEHMQPAFAKLNPSKLVPVLEDGDFRLTESSAILKYMAEKAGSAAYPADLKKRARINERMDWVNTQLCRDLAYGLVYPQIFPMHKREDATVQAATLKWAQERVRGWMKVLNDDILGGNAFLCGSEISIADYYGAAFVGLADAIRSDLSAYPNVAAWMGRMKALPNWGKVNEVINGFAASLPGPFETV